MLSVMMRLSTSLSCANSFTSVWGNTGTRPSSTLKPEILPSVAKKGRQRRLGEVRITRNTAAIMASKMVKN